MSISRRNFLKSATAGSVAIAGIPAVVSSCISPCKEEQKGGDIFSKGDVVLFQGDSITDAGRNRKGNSPNNSRDLGKGYAFLTAADLLKEQAEKGLSIYNKGISGNKVFQLSDRWQKDCFDLKPNVLSILIGVNDYWHFRNGKYDGTPEIFENDYRKLLTRTKAEIPDVKLVICEPFILTETRAVDESWIEPFKAYQDIAKKMADEFQTIWVPFQKVFTEAVNIAPAKYWTADGVHPSIAGARLMAEAWLKSVGV